MFKPLKHPHVKILEGVTQLVGQTGTIVDKEGNQYRVKLDTPTEVDGVGLVSSELFMPSVLKVLRSAPKPVPAAGPEAAAGVPLEVAAPQARPGSCCPRGGYASHACGQAS